MESDGYDIGACPRFRAWLGPAPSYEWTRFAILRLLGLVYVVAFAQVVLQGPALFGAHGLTPAAADVTRIVGKVGAWKAFWAQPSVFWLTGAGDGWLFGAAWLGLALAIGVLGGLANVPAMALLWAIYLSIIHVVPYPWFGYGWDMQLCETGFLAIFLVPALDPRPFPARAAPAGVIWLYRWLIVRIMLGAGLIKLRGDACWRDLTCLDFHFETQPNPNPLSRAFHFAPGWTHACGVLWNHLVEVVAPFLAFGPRRARHVAGALFVSFQLFLIVSGNLAFLNWLTIVPALACFDDSLWQRVLPSRAPPAPPTLVRRRVVWGLAAIVAFLSLDPIGNLISPRQAMNKPFEPFELVNTYGAFGSMSRERYQVVIAGSVDGTTWREYQTKCQPVALDRRPCWISPYHYRLDWQLWFAALPWGYEGLDDPQGYAIQQQPWLVHLGWKLLQNDRATLGLFASNPFPDAPPRFVRADVWRYEFARDRWWKRTPVGPWLPPISLDDPSVAAFLRRQGW